MKPTIHKLLTHDKLLRVVPERFSSLVPKALDEPITAVLFGEQVVTGRVAQKTFERISSDFGSSLVCVGRDFTAEAARIVTAAGAILVTESSGGTRWTDESLFTLRTSLGTNKKWPDIPIT